MPGAGHSMEFGRLGKPGSDGIFVLRGGLAPVERTTPELDRNADAAQAILAEREGERGRGDGGSADAPVVNPSASRRTRPQFRVDAGIDQRTAEIVLWIGVAISLRPIEIGNAAGGNGGCEASVRGAEGGDGVQPSGGAVRRPRGSAGGQHGVALSIGP